MAQILSIIIPSFQLEKTITAILDSVKQVELLNNIGKEIILVNDASSDGTDGVINRYISDNPELGISYYTTRKIRGKKQHFIRALQKQKVILPLFKMPNLPYTF